MTDKQKVVKCTDTDVQKETNTRKEKIRDRKEVNGKEGPRERHGERKTGSANVTRIRSEGERQREADRPVKRERVRENRNDSKRDDRKTHSKARGAC